jgi:hypothetical protein
MSTVLAKAILEKKQALLLLKRYSGGRPAIAQKNQ